MTRKNARRLLLLAVPLLWLLPAAAPASAADDPLAGQRVLVAGASGRAGRYVARQLSVQGVAFRAMARDPLAAVAALGPDSAGWDWVTADVRIRTDLRVPLAGVDLVICVIGSREIEGSNTAQVVDYGGVRNLVDAAKAAGVRHFVLLTAIGTTDPAHPFNRATRGALEWRFAGEEYLRDSGIPYTIVRPAGLVDRPAGEQAVLLDQGDRWQQYLRDTISRDELALVLIETLREPATRNATLEIVNRPAGSQPDWRAQLKLLRADPPR
jgi:uncharacterized protein YbjT (DUF2867 family)